MNNIPAVLSIAGTDPSGGAGIHADLKTFQECTAYGMAAVTTVVAQNTEGVRDVWHVPVEMVEKQIRSVFEDIRPSAVKTGMIATPEMMKRIAAILKEEKVDIVIDPVMVATSGDSLMEKETAQIMKEQLLPLAAVVTPNLEEAEKLTGLTINSENSAKEAAKILVEEFGCRASVVKGGHLHGKATDILYTNGEFRIFRASRSNTKNTHGTGCTFSAAIAAKLARGHTVYQAVEESKDFISKAIKDTLGLGKGSGPVNHWASRIELEKIKR
ncbi:bifunctional hydroxymethylpyrimidine kinase/phosphomethylpyrimidine kinase [Alteribacillus sp. HJP-4]|uniref:bifunctional hydroxymethylpyrimidine kinase/phosphomethylpyrimidine kinase n=1 Tax=Alteribacillus sp. HJP-4 TaxID=2775394 RepID=UPI0035CD3055